MSTPQSIVYKELQIINAIVQNNGCGKLWCKKEPLNNGNKFQNTPGNDIRAFTVRIFISMIYDNLLGETRDLQVKMA